MADDPARLARLRWCHPDLRARVERIAAALAAEGHPIVITQGVRTVSQQQALYAQGRTKPGKIVTNCDGVIKVSHHQLKDDGFGYAVDVAWRIGAEITWYGPWDRLGELAEAQGLVWGGRWRSFPDRPHLELPRLSAPTAVKA